MTAYDPDNIFAKILRQEIPCYSVYEDAATLAFMDIMPTVDGHCLVIPKTPARNIFDVDPAVLAALATVAQKVSKAACAAFEADGHVLRLHSEAAGGQEVFHIHFHVLPIKAGVPPRPRIMADHAVLATHAARIRESLA